jgi:hypothetical protein
VGIGKGKGKSVRDDGKGRRRKEEDGRREGRLYPKRGECGDSRSRGMSPMKERVDSSETTFIALSNCRYIGRVGRIGYHRGCECTILGDQSL